MRALALVTGACVALTFAGAAQATFPGSNGAIAYTFWGTTEPEVSAFVLRVRAPGAQPTAIYRCVYSYDLQHDPPCHELMHLAAGLGLERLGAALGGAAQPSQQLAWSLACAVVMAREEARHPLLAEPVRVGGGRVAAQERERDRAVDIGEHVRGAGPEALQLRAQLVRERDAMLDEVLAGARERP
jgi:hypothetical protein